MNPEIMLNNLFDFLISYGPRFIGAVLVFILGWWIIRIISNLVGRKIENQKLDPSLKPFISVLIKTLLKIMLLISVLGMIGIEMTSFIAILAAAGLAIGLALSGTLQNFAGGILILILKPFKSGDYIESQGFAGTVREIKIFYTVLKTPENVTIVLPNGELSNSSLKNYSVESVRRVDFTFGIGYNDSVENAREVLNRVLNEDQRVLNEPESPFIALAELGTNSVNIVVRVWVKAEDYWSFYFDMNEKVYYALIKEGISIPYPQMDVHIHNRV